MGILAKIVASVFGELLSTLLARKDLQDKTRLEVENAVLDHARRVLAIKPELSSKLRVREGAPGV